MTTTVIRPPIIGERTLNGRPELRVVRGAVAALVACAACAAAAPAYGAAPPPNDNYLSSTVIPQSRTTGMQAVSYTDVQDTTAATTQPDLFNPEQNGLPFAGGGPEPLSCGGLRYANTVWYDMRPRVDEGVQLESSGYPNAMVVYQYSTTTAKITRRLYCRTSAANQPNQFAVPFDIHRGDRYTIQIGGLQSASGVASGTLDFRATFYPDRDGDTVPDVLDGCPFLAGVRKFDGCPPAIHPLLNSAYVGAGASAIKLTSLGMSSLPGGASVRLRCSCGIRETAKAGPRENSVSFAALSGTSLTFGTTIQMWTTKRATHRGIYRYGAIGSYGKFTVTSGGLAGVSRGCLMPGSMTPRSTCPPGGRRHR